MTPEEQEQRVLYANILEYEQDNVSEYGVSLYWPLSVCAQLPVTGTDRDRFLLLLCVIP